MSKIFNSFFFFVLSIENVPKNKKNIYIFQFKFAFSVLHSLLLFKMTRLHLFSAQEKCGQHIPIPFKFYRKMFGSALQIIINELKLMCAAKWNWDWRTISIDLIFWSIPLFPVFLRFENANWNPVLMEMMK